MTDDQRTLHGIELDALKPLLAHETEIPEVVQFEFNTRYTYEDRCTHRLTKIDRWGHMTETVSGETCEFTTLFGDWREVFEDVFLAPSPSDHHGGSS